jgi:CrcB protein
MNVLYLVVGGALGALARYAVEGWVDDLAGPSGLGVFAVNMAGAFLIGLFLTASEERFVWPSELRLLVAVGFLGAFTTFSTLAWETKGMLDASNFGGAALNVAGSMVCGLAAVYAGSALGRAI